MGWPAGSQGQSEAATRMATKYCTSVHRHFRLVVMSAFTLFSGEWGPHQFRSQSLDTSARSIFPEAGAVVLQLTMNVTE